MAKTITITIDDTDEKVLLNDVLDINNWVQDAVTGKVNNSWKRMQSQWTTKLMNDDSFTDPIPSNKADFVTLVLARDDYQTRAERDAASQVGE
tara:strand:+ start:290 stop:568 length:279 start_codon:yes stop_codon:yes gene_type:complete